MNQLNQANIAIVRAAFKGAKLAKLDASLAVLEASIAQGAWTLRGSAKASSGFYQGIAKIRRDPRGNCDLNWYCVAAVSSPIEYGGYPHLMDPHDEADKKAWDAMTLAEKQAQGIKCLRANGNLTKISDETLLAWIALCAEVKAVSALLDDARPLPVVTAIGLSPKVTATLTEMNLDLDLPSIKMAKIETRYRDAFKYNKKTDMWEASFNKDGTRAQESYHVVVWSDGIEHNRSRFASGAHCHACGKNIPSGRFVPVEAFDKKSNKLISMWLGCDCSRNIFGIKDVGVEKSA